MCVCVCARTVCARIVGTHICMCVHTYISMCHTAITPWRNVLTNVTPCCRNYLRKSPNVACACVCACGVCLVYCIHICICVCIPVYLCVTQHSPRGEYMTLTPWRTVLTGATPCCRSDLRKPSSTWA